MKKFLSIVILAIAVHFTSVAQPATMTIRNNQNCPVTYHLYGSDGSTCFPTGALTTNTYTLGGFNAIVFNSVANLNGCAPPNWNITCGSCGLGAPCTCAVANGPTGVWDGADAGTPSGGVGVAQLGGIGGNSGVAGTCGTATINVSWSKNLTTGDVLITYY